MRISNSTIYNTNLKNMQSTLSDYMESNIQGGTQKQINKPSDDPAGIALVLNTRNEIESTEQYQRNLSTARGWLEMTDSTLANVSTTIAEIKTLAEQAASETMSPENRKQIAFQIEELFGQLMNLSNTEFEGNSIFAGHKYSENAFEGGLGVATTDENFDTSTVSLSGSTNDTIGIRFMTTGVVGTDALNYEWSDNGGETWNTVTLPAGESTLTINGVTMNIRPGTEVEAPADPTDAPEVDTADGTFLYIHPTADYKGDDNDISTFGVVTNGPDGLQTTITSDHTDNMIFELNAAVDLNVPGSPISYSITQNDGTVQNYTAVVPNPATGKVILPFDDVNGKRGNITLDITEATTSTLGADLSIDMQPRRVDMLGAESTDALLNAQGVYAQNTLVRLDANSDGTTTVDLGADGATVNYSYSMDGGQTWIKAVSVLPTPATGDARLALPGGFIEISTPPGGAGTLEAGTQMVIHPDRADLGYEVMANTYVPVNQVGKDIFGGQYNGQPVEGPNLFEVVGQLIAFCEFNETDGISQSLVTLTEAHEHVETEATRVGGLVNRLDLAENMLSAEKLNQQEMLSATEDIDLTELLNNLARQELAYSTVLQSSSMIMQLNLAKYV